MAKLPTATQLNQLREELISYMRMKITHEDWHGVADAAMDLREVDAKLEMLDWGHE